MSFFGGKKQTPKEQQREADRQLRRIGRDLERGRAKLDVEEKKRLAEIQKLAKEGNQKAAVILAKQVADIRKQKAQSYAASSKVSAVASKSTTMGAQMALQGAMASTSKTLNSMNQLLQPEKVMGDMRAFQENNMKMELKEEMLNDALDDMTNVSDDELESEGILSQILDEIGIEVAGAMGRAPTAGKEALGARQLGDDEIVAKLAQLKTLE